MLECTATRRWRALVDRPGACRRRYRRASVRRGAHGRTRTARSRVAREQSSDKARASEKSERAFKIDLTISASPPRHSVRSARVGRREHAHVPATRFVVSSAGVSSAGASSAIVCHAQGSPSAPLCTTPKKRAGDRSPSNKVKTRFFWAARSQCTYHEAGLVLKSNKFSIVIGGRHFRRASASSTSKVVGNRQGKMRGLD